MPIVIGDKNYRGKGIRKKVIKTLIERAKELEFEKLNVREIYSYNAASQRLFESMRFIKSSNTKNGFSYLIKI